MESRKRSRVEGRFQAVLEVEGDRLPVTTDNVSLSGMRVSCDCDMTSMLDKECRLMLRLSPMVSIVVESRIVRADGEDAALVFLEMDEESFSHLRNIVRYAAGDADEVDNEILQR